MTVQSIGSIITHSGLNYHLNNILYISLLRIPTQFVYLAQMDIWSLYTYSTFGCDEYNYELLLWKEPLEKFTVTDLLLE